MEQKERTVTNLCDRAAEALGWQVERYEQGRATMIHEGLPDRRYVHAGYGLRIWVEMKAPGGKLTTEQHRWLMDELEAGGYAVAIDDAAALVPLLQGLARGGMHRPEVARRCREITALVAARGYRKIRKSDGQPYGAPGAGRRRRGGQSAG